MVITPQIQIRQQPALLGIDADLGKQDIVQPRATFEMTTERPQQDIRQPRGDLDIDQSRSWDALGVGGVLQTMSRIYSKAPEIALQAIARIAQDGDRMAKIHIKSDAFKELAQNIRLEFGNFDVVPPTEYDNVDITYTANKADINVTDGRVNLNTQPNRPEISYNRGKLDIYMMQYPKVEITPPSIDYTV
ncbi:DUF6470 family protein [Paenibacillus sp. MBLB4367]|uniref:DUF6470 family protein n=1 Tax=Paenibacillus sp. MBLB4367 TaxID=3384767 RepID=UPI0039080C8F